MAPAGDIMRTLLIADVHANLAALRALPVADTIICAGDLVGFGSDPDSVVDWLRARAAICVRGDEDDAVAFGRQHVLPPGFEFAARETRRWTARTISPSTHAFLRSLPPEIERTIDQIHIAAVHAYPGDYDLYVEPTPEQLSRMARAFPHADLIVVGHTHRAGLWRVGRTRIVNPGSVGQPAHPGFAAYALLEDRRVVLHEVRFDPEATLHGVENMGLGQIARKQVERGILLGAVRPRERVALDESERAEELRSPAGVP
jgi:putative phosphoesterase